MKDYIIGVGILLASAVASITIIRVLILMLVEAWEDWPTFIALVIGIIWFLAMIVVWLMGNEPKYSDTVDQ